jgi:hypothetical protein
MIDQNANAQLDPRRTGAHGEVVRAHRRCCGSSAVTLSIPAREIRASEVPDPAAATETSKKKDCSFPGEKVKISHVRYCGVAVGSSDRSFHGRENKRNAEGNKRSGKQLNFSPHRLVGLCVDGGLP